MEKVPKQLQKMPDEGWSILIYSRDRRLLCSLDPSHGWTLLAGILLGFIFALVSTSARIPAQPSAPISAPMNAPLNLD